MFFLPNLKNNGVPFQAWHIFEDVVDDIQVLLPLQKTGSVLLEVVKEVVQDEVRPCNTRNAHFVYVSLSRSLSLARSLSLSLSHTHTHTHTHTHVSITRKLFLIVVPILLILHVQAFFNPYPTAFPYGNGMVLHFYQQQESSTTKTVHKVINRGLKAYV